MDAYKPVSCSFQDELEAIATLRQDCQITYRTEAGDVAIASGRIVDIYAANHADYMKMDDGLVVRLDRIVSLNDKPITSTADQN